MSELARGAKTILEEMEMEVDMYKYSHKHSFDHIFVFVLFWMKEWPFKQYISCDCQSVKSPFSPAGVGGQGLSESGKIMTIFVILETQQFGNIQAS